MSVADGGIAPLTLTSDRVTTALYTWNAGLDPRTREARPIRSSLGMSRAETRMAMAPRFGPLGASPPAPTIVSGFFDQPPPCACAQHVAAWAWSIRSRRGCRPRSSTKKPPPTPPCCGSRRAGHSRRPRRRRASRDPRVHRNPEIIFESPMDATSWSDHTSKHLSPRRLCLLGQGCRVEPL